MIVLAALAVAMGACATVERVERAQVANEAKVQMIGMTKEQVLACMGPPATKAAEGATEVWTYNTGNMQNGVLGIQRYCTINVNINKSRVTALNYLGPTGGLLDQGEQCGFALQNCVQPQ
jgi:outer membrane protein assembly factor BamE (lipoprotein component of BamABCDE complex)